MNNKTRFSIRHASHQGTALTITGFWYAYTLFYPRLKRGVQADQVTCNLCSMKAV